MAQLRLAPTASFCLDYSENLHKSLYWCLWKPNKGLRGRYLVKESVFSAFKSLFFVFGPSFGIIFFFICINPAILIT